MSSAGRERRVLVARAEAAALTAGRCTSRFRVMLEWSRRVPAEAMALCERGRQRWRRHDPVEADPESLIDPRVSFHLVGTVDRQTVQATCDGRNLRCDQELWHRAQVVAALGDEFRDTTSGRRLQACTEGPPLAIMLTLMRACDTIVGAEIGVHDAHQIGINRVV